MCININNYSYIFLKYIITKNKNNNDTFATKNGRLIIPSR